MEQLKTLAILFIGGGIGTLLRYGFSKIANPISTHFYWGTFGVNILGCLLLGMAIGYGLKQPSFATNSLYLFLVVGLCGGFTTFSTFALENHTLLKKEMLFPFLTYTIASIATGIIAVAAGLWISKSV